MVNMTSDPIVGDMDGNEVVRIDSKVIAAGMQASPDKSLLAGTMGTCLADLPTDNNDGKGSTFSCRLIFIFNILYEAIKYVVCCTLCGKKEEEKKD